MLNHPTPYQRNPSVVASLLPSRQAFGVMFWWCNKDKWDEDGNEVERCKFARRVDQGRARVCKFWRETGSCKKGVDCSFAHEIGGELTWKGKDGSIHQEAKGAEEGEKELEKVEKVVEVESEEVAATKADSDSESDSDESDSESDSSSSSSSSSSSDSE